MIFRKMFKLFIKSVFIYFVIIFNSYSDEQFGQWLKNFQIEAIKSGISKDVVVDVMSNAKFLPKVIEYDRYQPEFYEDTFTYIKKRTSKKKLKVFPTGTMEKMSGNRKEGCHEECIGYWMDGTFYFAGRLR